ncbi:Grap2 and cyclin-D-interacting-domain-containing protein [Salix suchowensis]|nr:Grap2 and cyclin-D-interacting-domain-containing protein [Salix suchowensis]
MFIAREYAIVGGFENGLPRNALRGKAQETAANGGKGRCRGAPKDSARREAQCAHMLVVANGEQREGTEVRILTAQEVGGMQLCTEMPKVKKPDEQPTLVIIQKDLSSLLSLIYEAATKLALSLKPSSPTYSASLTPIREISERVAAVAHCVLFIDPNLHGATLFKEAVETVKDVIEATSSLADAFLAAASTPNPRDEYLSRTGTVHELAEKAKNLSLSNVLAVQKRWKQDRASLDDAVSELHDMLEQAEADDGTEQLDADFDDGWAEFGIGSDKKLEVDELARAKKAYTFLRYTSLLHKRVLQDILTTQESNTDNPSPSVYDGMCNASATLLICADDFVAALYGHTNLLTSRKNWIRFWASSTYYVASSKRISSL